VHSFKFIDAPLLIIGFIDFDSIEREVVGVNMAQRRRLLFLDFVFQFAQRRGLIIELDWEQAVITSKEAPIRA